MTNQIARVVCPGCKRLRCPKTEFWFNPYLKRTFYFCVSCDPNNEQLKRYKQDLLTMPQLVIDRLIERAYIADEESLAEAKKAKESSKTGSDSPTQDNQLGPQTDTESRSKQSRKRKSPLRICSRCKEPKPSTIEYFNNPHGQGRRICIACLESPIQNATLVELQS